MMEINNIDEYRITLPPGTVLNGSRGTYVVQNLICISERSLTVSCVNSDGRKYRLKYYNPENSAVTESVQHMLCSVNVKGTLLPYDMGEYAGARFTVYPDVEAECTDQILVSSNILANYIIPQMVEVMEKFHQEGLLLRDICPEHILYLQENNKIVYCGFNNAIQLAGKTTATRAPGFGQHPSYIAPEVERYGYSKASDYFSLGVTLLALVHRKNLLENISKSDFVMQFAKGIVPGINVQYLSKTEYEYCTTEDRILYLILGFLIPNPQKRWGYDEFRCWNNQQKIPLLQTGERIKYQFTEPFVIGTTKCWNEKQIAQKMAEHGSAWNATVAKEFLVYAKRNRIKSSTLLAQYYNDKSLSAKGIIFRYIYTLNPTMSGFWWEGEIYRDTTALIREVKSNRLNQTALSLILKDRCISFLEESRAKFGVKKGASTVDIDNLEKLEQAKPGYGVQRCFMVFTSPSQDRYFKLYGKEFKNFKELLISYQSDGKKLRENSADIILNSSFQAWLWANGMETVGQSALQIVQKDPNQGFYLLLSMCEGYEKDITIKGLARKLYLQYGDYAPIIWLTKNIRAYKMTSPTQQILYDVFANANFGVGATLDSLRQKAQGLLQDYQTFISRTREKVVSGRNFTGYEPIGTDYYFCCTWRNNLKVCPAFLKSVGERS